MMEDKVRRDIGVNVKLNPSEYEMLRSIAGRLSMTVSETLRYLIRKESE